MRAARRDRRVMCTTLRNGTTARTAPIHNCGSNSSRTQLSIWMLLARLVTVLPPVRLLVTSANASCVEATAVGPLFRSTGGERGEDKRVGRRIPTMWEDAVYARALPHETLSPQESASLSHPRKARALSPLGNHASDDHTRPRACSPRFELDAHPQPQRTRTDPTGQPFLQVTGSPTQRRVAPTATQRTHHHAKSNLGDEKKRGMRMRYPAVQILFGPCLSRAGIVRPAPFPCRYCRACVLPAPVLLGLCLSRAGLFRPATRRSNPTFIFLPRVPYSWSSVKRISAMNTSGSSPVFSMPCR